MTAPAITLWLFLLGMVLVAVSMIPGLNVLLLVGVALFIPIASALLLNITKDLS